MSRDVFDARMRQALDRHITQGPPEPDDTGTCPACQLNFLVDNLAWMPDPKTYEMREVTEGEFEWDADVRAKCPVCDYVLHRSLLWEGIPTPTFD